MIRKKFSASRYFEDCCKHNVTVINYIGEICRYLLATPNSEYDKSHKIKVATGNGLRPSIWEEFTTRFNIPFCAELYGSTEGNANMINMTGKVGSVGFTSVIVPFIFPMKLIKVDKETGTLIIHFFHRQKFRSIIIIYTSMRFLLSAPLGLESSETLLCVSVCVCVCVTENYIKSLSRFINISSEKKTMSGKI